MCSCRNQLNVLVTCAWLWLCFVKIANHFAGVLEKAGVHPEVHRIGPYKSVGEQLTHKSMSKEVREMFSSLLDCIYENWLESISLSQGISSCTLWD